MKLMTDDPLGLSPSDGRSVTVEASDPIARGQAVLAQIKEAIAKVDPLLAKVEEINQRIARGEGSLGRLMNDPEFPEDAKELGKILKRHPWRVIDRPQK